MRALARAAASLVVVAGLSACATHYVSPDPGAGPTALITVHSPLQVHLQDLLLRGSASSLLSIYSADGPCDPTAGDMDDAYRGSVNLSESGSEFRVAAERPVFFQFSYLESNQAVTNSATTRFGFVPRADQSYTLEIHLAQRTLGVDVTLAGAPVEVMHPSACFARGW